MNISFNFPKGMKAGEKLKSLFNIKLDSSLYFLIVANVITIIMAIYEKLDFPTVLFIYWCQSVIIGVFSFIKILSLKNFTTENFTINGKGVEATPGTRNFTAFFFLIHYGAFHLVYLFFLFGYAEPNLSIIFPVVVCSGVFFMNHLFSFSKNFKEDRERKQNIGRVMSAPYARILPMHLAFVFGFILLGNAGIIYFLILKTIADVVMHNAEHSDLANYNTVGI